MLVIPTYEVKLELYQVCPIVLNGAGQGIDIFAAWASPAKGFKVFEIIQMDGRSLIISVGTPCNCAVVINEATTISHERYVLD